MIYTVIDGDMADFIEAERDVSRTFSLIELKQYLTNEGHPQEVVFAAINRWSQEWFAFEGHTFQLTKVGDQAVNTLNASLE